MTIVDVRSTPVRALHCKNVWITSTHFWLPELHRTIDDLQLRCPKWVKVTQSFLQCTVLHARKLIMIEEAVTLGCCSIKSDLVIILIIMTAKEVVTVIINDVQLHWVTAARSASPCRACLHAKHSQAHSLHRCCGTIPGTDLSRSSSPPPADDTCKTPLPFRFWMFHCVFAGEMLEIFAIGAVTAAAS